MGKKLEGKVVLITGASRGLGKEMAIHFSGSGAKTAICARTTDQLKETEKLCKKAGGDALAVTCDVSKKDQLKNFFDKAAERFGTVDALVNNAAYNYSHSHFLDQTDDDLEKAFATGLFAVWNSMQFCFPYMKSKGGAIVNILSPVYLEAMYGQASASADKSGIRGLSSSAARDWAKYKIRINTVSPSIGGTIYQNIPEGHEFWQQTQETHFGTPAGITSDALSVARVVAFLISDDSEWVMGQNINVDGGRCIYHM